MLVYYNNDRENARNTHYPHRVEIGSIEDLKNAMSHDNTPVEFRENRRSRDNYVQSNCVAMDVDNTHSEDSSDWVTPTDIQARFPDVPCYIVYSRNHEKWKGEKPPRPKFHVYFPVKVYTDREEYENLKNKVCRYFPEFDQNAKDSARFFFGVENPRIEFIDGKLLLSKFMETIPGDEDATSAMTCKKQELDIIPEGSRHSTLIKYAARVLKRYGDTEQATQLFEHESEKCVPRLGEKELASIWKDAREFFHKKIKPSPGYLSSEQREMVSRGDTLKPDDFTDLGQAKVFVKKYKDEIRFSPATKYIVYTGKVWRENEVKARGLVQQLTDSQLDEVSYLMKEARKKHNNALIEDDTSNQDKAEAEMKTINDYKRFVMKYRNHARIIAVFEEAKPMVEIDVNDLDKDEKLLNTPAGTVDLRNGKLNPHNPLDYCTKITAISPDRKNAYMFYEFLRTITCNDRELEDYLQVISGMCLIGKVYSENLIIAYGGGKNGKSTFFNLLFMVMGEYSGTISTEVLIKDSRIHKGFEFAGLHGKRLVLASELEKGKRLDSSAIKHMCSTDVIHAEKKHKDSFTFTPTHTTILYTNPLPSVKELDDGTWRRLVVIPFNAVIQDDMDIKNYASYLFQNCGGAVLSWMIEGAQKFIRAKYKLSPPNVVKRAIENYRNENNWIQHYLSEYCETGTGRDYRERAGNLYDKFREFCNKVGEPYKSKAAFKDAMIGAGFKHCTDSKG